MAWGDDNPPYNYADSVYPTSERAYHSEDDGVEVVDDGYYEENDYWDDDDDGDENEGYDDAYGDDGGGYDEGVPRWVPPSVTLAERHAQRVNPQHALARPLRVAPGDLNEYGIGVVLYFTFLRLLVLAFAGLAVLAVPLGLANLAGNALGRSEDPLSVAVETTSLGNYGKLYAWTRGGDGANETLDMLSGAPPAPVASITYAVDPKTGVNQSRVPWTHGEVHRANVASAARFRKDDLNVVMTYVDLVLLAGFALFSFALGPIKQRIAASVDRDMTTIEDYSVLVQGIPKDVLDPQEVWKFFGKRVGVVADVQIALNDSELLALAFERGRVSDQLERSTAKWYKAMDDPNTTVEMVKRIEAEGKQVKKALRATNAGIRQLQNERGTGSESVCAYVTFQDEEAFLRCLKLYRPGNWLSWVLRPGELRLRGTHRLMVTQAPAPTDIQWENLEFTWAQRMLRAFSVTALTVGIMAAAFVAIAAVKQVKESTAVEWKEAECRQTCKYEVVPKVSLTNSTLRGTYAECFARELEFGPPPAPPAPYPPPVSFGRRMLQEMAFNASNVTCGPTDAFCYSCYCLELVSTQAIMRETEYCSAYVKGYTMQLIAAASAQGVIVLFNMVLKRVIVKVVRYERHHSASSEQKSVMKKLFLAQFFNSALILVVVDMYLPWLKKAIKGTMLSGMLFEGELDDLTPKWYQEVGYALVVSMIATPMVQRCQTFVRYYRFTWNRSGAKTKALTQRQLNEAYEGAEFVLSTRYGEILNIIFVTLTFSAGLPILVPLAALSFAQHYLIDKFEFLRVSKLPPRYSTALAQGAAELMVYACIGHLLFALWANSHYRMDPEPFVSSVLGTYVEQFAKMWKQAPTPINNLFGAVPDTAEVARRVLQRNTAWATLALCMVIVFVVIRAVAGVIRAVLAVLLPSVFLRTRTAEGNPSFDVAVAGRQLAGPSTYCVRELPEYAPAYVKVEWEQDDGRMDL